MNQDPPRYICRRRLRLLLLSVLLASFVLGASAFAAAPKPNIIVILVDDIGVGDFGFTGGKDFPTPNIDRLAREGVVFSHGYAMPSCSPTRAALLTGRYPQRFGIEDNRPLDGPRDGLDRSEILLPQKLREAGYATKLVGKWHLGKGNQSEFAPRNRGFDEFFGYFGAAGTYVNPVFSRDGAEKQHEGYNTDLLTDEACRIIKAAAGKPFFLHLAYMAAHHQQVARPQDLARVAHLSGVRQRGAAIMVNLDDNIGRLLDTLQQTGLDTNTLVFFISDNGAEPPLLGTSNGPHRGQKFDVLEGGIRVPFAARWPGTLPAGKRFEPMVHVMDVFPTALAAAGLTVPANLDGVNLLPYVLGKTNGVPHSQLCWLFNDHKEWRIPGRDTNLARPLRAIREGNFKLVMEGDNAPELYDVVADPGEANNLAARDPERVAQMKRTYEAWRAQMKPQVIPDDHPLYGRYKKMAPGRAGKEAVLLRINALGEANQAAVLTTASLKQYVEQFNALDEEIYRQAIPNAEAYEFLKDNIPLFSCPDKLIERTYYFRWWTYRKHIKQTPVGYIITEFLPEVPWAGKYNAIPCAGMHHFMEGRWLRDPKFLRDYANFWARHAGMRNDEFKAVLGHGFPFPSALYNFHLVHPSRDLLIDLYPELAGNYAELKTRRGTPTGLFWSKDGSWLGDGMEVGISGQGIRPTINSYMYAQARALAYIAEIRGETNAAVEFNREADFIADRMMDLLWDEKAGFFKVIRQKDISTRKLADVREQIGFVPWYFSIPSKGKGYERAWEQLMDPEGFFAPFGPTTAEQRHPGFRVAYQGHECQWNGPSWPYATAQTLTAMANVLNDYPQTNISKQDYFKILQIYANSHAFRQIPVGAAESNVVVRLDQPWIDENLNPQTGDWLARTRLEVQGKNGHKPPKERGKDYNHSTFCDLIITGLVGLRPRADDLIEVNPLLPPDTWDWFCLDKVSYRNRTITIIWDKTGRKFGKGPGLFILADGREIARAPSLSRVVASLTR